MQTTKVSSRQWAYVIYLVANAGCFAKLTSLGVYSLYLR